MYLIEKNTINNQWEECNRTPFLIEAIELAKKYHINLGGDFRVVDRRTKNIEFTTIKLF